MLFVVASHYIFFRTLTSEGFGRELFLIVLTMGLTSPEGLVEAASALYYLLSASPRDSRDTAALYLCSPWKRIPPKRTKPSRKDLFVPFFLQNKQLTEAWSRRRSRSTSYPEGIASPLGDIVPGGYSIPAWGHRTRRVSRGMSRRSMSQPRFGRVVEECLGRGGRRPPGCKLIGGVVPWR